MVRTPLSAGRPDAEVAVAVRGLVVDRGSRRVFDGIELTIPRGQITGVLGPSGCGKTTLLRAIVGVQKIQGGSITVLGVPAGERTLRADVRYDTQAASVYDDLTVQQNLRYFARVLGANSASVSRVLADVDLSEYARTLVSRLSGGQRSRVSLAVALLGAPQVLVLDEPTVGLDPVLRRELWELFRRLTGLGKTLIVSSHVMDEALRCDGLILMREGEIIANTTPHELLTQTATADPESAFLRLIDTGPRPRGAS